jgi:hypothetical protein
MQLDLFHQAAKHFQVTLEFPSQGDRLAFQRFFKENPFVGMLTEFFAGRLTPEECLKKINALAEKTSEGEE